ncbi:MAG TPA: fibronectin type III domain-containing protein, partial [Chryseosolibacter sp.]|nr:fibronectin type III domain-containing protein [Chryseosolibacter sp.]
MKKTLLALLVLISHAGWAQVYPLQVNAQLTPPYSPYLSDYTAPGGQNFTVQIRANDVTLTNYQCRLRLTIEGVGITIRTKATFHPQPLTLAGGGMPEIFYGEDLIEYFDPDALDFAGYSRVEYDRTARLPEGIYRFTVEVVDYYRGTIVSNAGTATAWIVLNSPPLLNLPANHSKIKIQEPPAILFSWTPRHTGSPNAAFTTEYTFKIVELWYANQNPNDAFLTQAPLYETTTDQTQTFYGISEPALIPGRAYAWQVIAHDTQGKDLFKNKGASEVFVFQYGEELAVPDNLLMRWAKPTTLAIRWDPVRNDTEEVKYRLAYRPRRRTADDNHEWYETKTKFTEKTLYDLRPDTEYEVKVRTELIAQQSEYTETQVFKTLKEEVGGFVCRDNVPAPPPPEDTKAVFPLSVNDTLHAGGYDVLVRDVMNVDGKYFGSGLAIVPWFNSAKVRITFENISVNDRFWLKRGAVKSVWSADSKFLLDVEKPIEPGTAPKTGNLDITVVSADTLITVKGAAIATVTKDQDENIVVTTTDGGKQVLRKGESYAIADETGNGYVIDNQGHIAKTTATEAQAAATRGNREYDMRVAFSSGKGRFGFDIKDLDVLSQFYQRLDDGTFVPWKALATGQPDAVGGRVSSEDIDARRLKFKVGSSQVVPSTSSGATFALTVNGKAGGMEEELLALYAAADTLPEKVLGKLNLVTYNMMRYNLVIVPVNGAAMPGDLSAEAIADSLNRVYGQAVVEWTVAVEKGINVPLGETFDEGQPGLFANYTGDMKKVISAHGDLRKNTFYLFLINRPRDPSTLGYMPRNRQAGFVFIESHRGDIGEFTKTIAHELGHGAFNLRHIFAEYGLPIGATNNLMDYGSGTSLHKYQWDAVHNPQTVFGLFDEEGENASQQMTAEPSLAWWTQLPPYEKAAAILKEHFDDLDIFKSVESTCSKDKCVITAELPMDDDMSYAMEVTFKSTMSADSLLQILYSDYRVDLW